MCAWLSSVSNTVYVHTLRAGNNPETTFASVPVKGQGISKSHPLFAQPVYIAFIPIYPLSIHHLLHLQQE